jgi:hypothetical protein
MSDGWDVGPWGEAGHRGKDETWHGRPEAAMSKDTGIYDDGRIACTAERVVIRRYYPWGAKRIPYASIKGINERR